MEEWRKIPGLPEIYEASSLGRIRRASAVTFQRMHRGKLITQAFGAKIFPLKKLSSKGYPRIRINLKGYQVHRLVALAFIPNPINLPQVNHINGIKTDNRIKNLQWCTNQENRDHAVVNGLHPRGERLSKKFKNLDIKAIRFLSRSGVKQQIIADIFKSNQQTISSIVLNKCWSHITE